MDDVFDLCSELNDCDKCKAKARCIRKFVHLPADKSERIITTRQEVYPSPYLPQDAFSLSSWGVD